MKYNILYILLFFLLLNKLSAQVDTINPKLDHKVFVEELKNSQQIIYDDVIKKYDDYLSKNGDDILVQIEKCKFVQIAQYDDEEEYNPNQEYFDSCSAALFEKYPDNPDVLLYHTTLLWNDELNHVLEKAVNSINENPDVWSKTNSGLLYFTMANHQYSEGKYYEAETYMEKACYYDEQYKTSLEYAQILVKLNKNKEALTVLKAGKDTTQEAWQLNQKADLLLQLMDYKYAIKLYNLITKIDSDYLNNKELAQAFEGVKEYTLARKYLVADTSSSWDNKSASLNLFLFDLKYQNGDTCLCSYNAYRKLGFSSDPLGLYRLKLFFNHPFLSWKWHDFLGILVLLLLIIVLIILPSIWIFPIYFIGNKWKIIEKTRTLNYNWGLKSFWWVSIGILIACLGIIFVKPDLINVFSSDSTTEVTNSELGLYILVYILILTFVGFSVLYKVNPGVFLAKNWALRKSFGVTILCFAIFRTIAGIHVAIGTKILHIPLSDISFIRNLLLSTNSEINIFISEYGSVVGLFLFGLLVPVYEEVIFRGVILDSCKRYLTFKWANIFQATLFAALHNSLFLFPLFLGFGIVTGMLKEKSGGLIPGIAFHVLNNILVVSVLIFRTI